MSAVQAPPRAGSNSRGTVHPRMTAAAQAVGASQAQNQSGIAPQQRISSIFPTRSPRAGFLGGSESSAAATAAKVTAGADDAKAGAKTGSGASSDQSTDDSDTEGETLTREERVMRYLQKKKTRTFSTKIRYQIRKLNAERRPRIKGRFVKREELAAMISAGVVLA